MTDAALERLAGVIHGYIAAKTRAVVTPPTNDGAERICAELRQMVAAASSPYATLPEAANYCRVSIATVARAIDAGLVQKLKPSGCASVRVRKSDLDRWMQDRRKPGPK